MNCFREHQQPHKHAHISNPVMGNENFGTPYNPCPQEAKIVRKEKQACLIKSKKSCSTLGKPLFETDDEVDSHLQVSNLDSCVGGTVLNGYARDTCSSFLALHALRIEAPSLVSVSVEVVVLRHHFH